MGKIRQLFLDLSLRKSIALYITAFAILAILLSILTSALCNSAIARISNRYPPAGELYYLTNSNHEQLGGGVHVSTSHADMSTADQRRLAILDAVISVSVPLYSALCVIAAALLFYRNKLKMPLALLTRASGKISENDLDFSVDYTSKDEFGRLCDSYEKMRASLEESNRDMWLAMEERKRLNAAFSHDLRTPLTVLRGYADFLKNYLPQGRVSEEKMIATVSTMSDHIARLENYVLMMSEAQKLDDITVTAADMEVCTCLEQLQNTVKVLAQNTGLDSDFRSDIQESEICLDFPIVLRVYENLTANAARHAQSSISVLVQYAKSILTITVSDDGKGFSEEDLKQADKPYYKNHSDGDEPHFGLGLYICRILCEKHGGSLRLENSNKGGAQVSATFHVNC